MNKPLHLLALPLLFAAVAGAPSAQAASSAELRQVLDDLMAWWPGDYDTAPQLDFEQRYGAPPDGEHDRQARLFRRVDVPHIGEHVLYGEVHVGGTGGDIIPGQQVLYIVTIDEARNAVNVSGRRILNGPEFQLKDQTPEKLRNIQIDPNVGGNCHFLWRRQGRNLVAHLSDLDADTTTCTMVSKTSGQKMTWDAEWVLTPEELWVFDNGYLHDQKDPSRSPRMFAGRADRAFEKLYKGVAYRCSVVYPDRSAQSASVQDHGGELPLRGEDKLRLQLLRSDYEQADGRGLERRLRLALLPEGSDEPVASTLKAGRPGPISLAHEGIKATCKP